MSDSKHMTRRKQMLIAAVAGALVMGAASPIITHAADYYHNTIGDTTLADKAPYYGNFFWGNRASQVVFEVHDYWSTNNANRIRSGNYRMEVEAYKPRPWWQGGNLYCDQLDLTSVTPYELPVTGYAMINECGGPGEELVHLYLYEPSIDGNIWYRHWQWFNKAPGGITQGEVNYSFSYDPGNDLWLGKVNYNSAYNATSSDRPGLLNIY